MPGTYLIINHMQSSYTDYVANRDKLVSKINDFVHEARPYLQGIIWSYATKGDWQGGKAFHLEEEKLSSHKAEDLVLANGEGSGREANILSAVYRRFPHQVILGGVFYDACSLTMASALRESGVKVAVPQELGNRPSDMFEVKSHREAFAQMHAQGIDVHSSVAQLLKQLKKPSWEMAGPERGFTGLRLGRPPAFAADHDGLTFT